MGWVKYHLSDEHSSVSGEPSEGDEQMVVDVGDLTNGPLETVERAELGNYGFAYCVLQLRHGFSLDSEDYAVNSPYAHHR